MNIIAANLWALHARAAAEVATEQAASIISSLVLRRRYLVPVTFADLRRTYKALPICDMSVVHREWHSTLKQVTSALDEVYAVVDGRDVRVATVPRPWDTIWMDEAHALSWRTNAIDDLYKAADEQGYWERPHEVRLELLSKDADHA